LRSPRLSTVVGAALALWGLGVGLLRLHDNSFLTELATGRLILGHGFPHSDPYSFTAHGHVWVLESWLASVLYAGLDKGWEGHGLQLLHGALAVTLTALVWRLTRPARALPGRILATAVALVVGTGFWSPRPLLIALVALATLVVLSEEPRWPAWLAVPLLWIWMQVHGSWPFAIGYLVVRIIGRGLERQPLDHLPRLLGAAGVGILLGLANPYGWRLLAYPLVVFTHHQAFSRVVEWQSPNFSSPVNAVFLAGALLALVLAAARRSPLEDGLVAAVFLAAACVASRNIAVASLVMVPVLARGLSGLGTLTGERRGPATVAAFVLIVLVGASMVTGALRSPAFDLSGYPVRAVTWMQRQHLIPGRVATQDFVGNYLEYRYGTRASAFIDDRVDMYPEGVERAYAQLLGGAPQWRSVLDRYDIRAVLWARSQPLASLVSVDSAWRVVYRDNGWIVAVRTKGTGAS
jgi:hypothetical protein